VTGRGGAIPSLLRERFADWRWALVYQGERADTYRLHGSSGEARFLKIAPHGFRPSVLEESERLIWARSVLPVPHVVDVGIDGDIEWLLTEGLAGSDATAAVVGLGREAVVRALARGLKSFHEAPPDGCPFSFGLDDALSLAERRLEEGSIVPDRDFHPEHAHLSAVEAIHALHRTRPVTEGRVVCHGDYCPPNALLLDGEVVGFVDLGELGTADPWWDLAVGSWSVGWNFGADLEPLFLAEYGVENDPHRRAFYRLLYDVVS
jgi:kanamycin kinase